MHLVYVETNMWVIYLQAELVTVANTQTLYFCEIMAKVNKFSRSLKVAGQNTAVELLSTSSIYEHRN